MQSKWLCFHHNDCRKRTVSASQQIPQWKEPMISMLWSYCDSSTSVHFLPSLSDELWSLLRQLLLIFSRVQVGEEVDTFITLIEPVSLGNVGCVGLISLHYQILCTLEAYRHVTNYPTNDESCPSGYFCVKWRTFQGCGCTSRTNKVSLLAIKLKYLCHVWTHLVDAHNAWTATWLELATRTWTP